jgi:hypothetical protein
MRWSSADDDRVTPDTKDGPMLGPSQKAEAHSRPSVRREAVEEPRTAGADEVLLTAAARWMR